jgi:integrase
MQEEVERPRRLKVKGRRGIYYRDAANGRRAYEITYTDSEGRRRWQRVPGGLKDAEAALEEMRRRLRRGERVAPTRATFAEVAESWISGQTQLRPTTSDRYRWALDRHLLPRFGRLRISAVTTDHVAVLIADMREAGYRAWTIKGVLTPLARVFAHAARRGLIAENPVSRLERGERPPAERQEMRILDKGEIATLLAAADDRYRPLLATAVFTGLRVGELLGLTWRDIGFEGGALRVRKQLDRDGARVEPKTPQAIREVILMPALGRILREHRVRSPYSSDGDFVFASAEGTGLDRRNAVRRGLGRAAREGGLEGADRPKLRFHDLRHTFASLLVAQGHNVVFVSRQLGHASPTITLGVYAHLFDRAEHGQRARIALEAAFGSVLEGAYGETRPGGSVAVPTDVLDLPVHRTGERRSAEPSGQGEQR